MRYQDVKAAAAGRWEEIVRALVDSDEMGSAIDRGHRRHGPCPHHGGTDGFRVFRDFDHTGGAVCATCGVKANGFALLAWLRQSDIPEAIKAVDEYFSSRSPSAVSVVAMPTPNAAPTGVSRGYLEKLWAEARKTGAQPALLKRYLRSRGLSGVVPPSLRLHPALPYYGPEGDVLGRFPTLLARVVSREGDLLALHRTYLSPRGAKADVPNARKLMLARGATVSGGAIHLFPAVDGAPLGLAEGLETGLSAHEGTGMAVWSTVSATLLANVAVPETVGDIFIWADKDRSGAGEAYAQRLRERLVRERPHRRSRILVPPMQIPAQAKSVDWNDMLRRFQERRISSESSIS